MSRQLLSCTLSHISTVPNRFGRIDSSRAKSRSGRRYQHEGGVINAISDRSGEKDESKLLLLSSLHIDDDNDGYQPKTEDTLNTINTDREERGSERGCGEAFRTLSSPQSSLSSPLDTQLGGPRDKPKRRSSSFSVGAALRKSQRSWRRHSHQELEHPNQKQQHQSFFKHCSRSSKNQGSSQQYMALQEPECRSGEDQTLTTLSPMSTVKKIDEKQTPCVGSKSTLIPISTTKLPATASSPTASTVSIASNNSMFSENKFQSMENNNSLYPLGEPLNDHDATSEIKPRNLKQEDGSRILQQEEPKGPTGTCDVMDEMGKNKFSTGKSIKETSGVSTKVRSLLPSIFSSTKDSPRKKNKKEKKRQKKKKKKEGRKSRKEQEKDEIKSQSSLPSEDSVEEVIVIGAINTVGLNVGSDEKLPPWNAELVLSMIRQHQGKDQTRFQNSQTSCESHHDCSAEKHDESCRDGNNNNYASSNNEGNKNNCHSHQNEPIQEEDWWKTIITEESDDNSEIDCDDGDARDTLGEYQNLREENEGPNEISGFKTNGNNHYNSKGNAKDSDDSSYEISKRSSLPLCATASTYSSDSSSSLLSNLDSYPVTSAEEEQHQTKKRRRNKKKKESAKKTNRRKRKIQRKEFWNIGLCTWKHSRAAWKSYDNNGSPPLTNAPITSAAVAEVTPTTTPFQSSSSSLSETAHVKLTPASRSRNSLTTSQYEEVVKGLTSVSREYLLPAPLSLSTLIGVYVDIWDCDNDY